MPVFEEQVQMLTVIQAYKVIESDSMVIYRDISNASILTNSTNRFEMPRPMLVHKIGIFGTFEHVKVYVADINDCRTQVFEDKYRTSYINIGNFDIVMTKAIEVTIYGNSSLRELSVYKSVQIMETP